MPERVSALAGHTKPRQLGLIGSEGPGVRLSERRIESLWQIAAWAKRMDRAAGAAAGAAGADAAPGPGQSCAGEHGTLLRTEPLKWLLIGTRPLTRPAIEAEDGVALDLSHARTVIRIEGRALPELMARMVPLDLRPRAFPEGRVASSGLHHMGVTIHRRGDGIDLYALRSFGLSVWEHLIESAEQFGVEIG